MIVAGADDIEIWRPVVGYELDYEVSSHGRIRRLRQGASPIATAGRYLKLNPGSRYARVTLVVDGIPKSFSIHRLILLAFVGPPPEGKEQGAHFDGNGHNNKLSNLRWASAKENSADRIRHGTQTRGANSPNTNLTQERVDAIRKLGRRGIGYGLIAIVANIGVSSAQRILRGKTYK